MKKNILLLLFFVGIFIPSNAQISIKGVVLGEGNNEKIVGAAVLLMPPARTIDSSRNKPISKVLTSNLGVFNISVPEFGSYRLVIRAFGFSPFVKLINVKSNNIDLNTLSISRSDIELQETEVISKGPSMLNGLDRKVYNVAEDLLVTSGTGTDILRQVPNVTLDIDGNVALRGDENVTILIDGRPASMMGYRGVNAFDRLPSGTVQRVEVITNPGAKFDAQGTGGVINIVTKKDRNLPFNGSLQSGIGTRNKNNLGGSISIPLGAFRINTNIGLNDRTNLGGGETDREYRLLDTAYSTEELSHSERENLSFNAQFGLDWEIANKYIFGFSTGISQRFNNSWDSTSFENTSGDKSITSKALQRTTNKSEDRDKNFSLRFEKKFKEDNKKWTADFRFSNNEDEGRDISIFDRDSIFPVAFTYDGAAQEDFIVIGSGKRANFQTDFEWPLSDKTKLDFGYRGNWRNTLEDQKAEQRKEITSNANYDSLRSFKTDMKNQVHASYITLGHAFSEKWKGQFGLRYENAIIDIRTSDTSSINRILPGLFPSAYLNYSPKKGTDFQLSYSLRVNRPDGRWGGNLNPNIDYSNPSSLRKGNPELNPEFTHSIDFSAVQYGRWGSLSGSFYSKHTVNMMSRYLETRPDGVVMMTWKNFDSRDNLGISTNANIRLNKNIRFQLSGDAFYAVINGRNVGLNINQNGFGWQGRSSMMIQTAKDQQLQISYSQWGAGPTGQGFRKGIHFVNAAYKVDLLNKRLSLSARISDIFNTRKFRYLQYTDRLDIDFMRYRESMVGWISLQYNFGKKDSRASRGKYRSGKPGGGMDIGM